MKPTTVPSCHVHCRRRGTESEFASLRSCRLPPVSANARTFPPLSIRLSGEGTTSWMRNLRIAPASASQTPMKSAAVSMVTSAVRLLTSSSNGRLAVRSPPPLRPESAAVCISMMLAAAPRFKRAFGAVVALVPPCDMRTGRAIAAVFTALITSTVSQ